MYELNDNDLVKIVGGVITSSLINAITKAASSIYYFGQVIGTNIRRIRTNSYCPV